jgi:hypothetical protein
MNKIKNTKKPLKNVRIECNGNSVFFDGKFDSQKNELRIYRYYGDVTILESSIKKYAIDNKVTNVILKCC